MDLYILVYLTYVFCGIFCAIWLLKLGPRRLMFWSTVYIAYSTLPTASMLVDSKIFNNPKQELIGQSLLVFFSVVGGAMFSSAWTELRRDALSKQA
jgi:hypothetical protein